MRYNILYILFHFFSFVLTAYRSQAQYDDSSFTRYTSKDGLSNNYIKTMSQDDRGYMWIGTDNGLNRFDGHSFKSFYQGSSALPLPSNTIWKLKSFGDHRLGIISLRGFQVLNTNDFTVTNYFVKDSAAFTAYRNYTLDAAALPGETFGLATATGFYTFNKEGEIIFRHEKYTAVDIDKKRILYARKILPLNEKQFAVYVEEDGIATYDPEKKIFHELSMEEYDGKTIYYPADKTVGYWIDQFPINTGEFILLLQKKDSIVYYDHARQKTTTSPLPFKLSQEFNWTARISRLDDTLFAINSFTKGFFIFHFDRNSGNIVFESKRYLPEHRISCLFLDNEKKLWVGTYNGLLYQKQASSFITKYHYPATAPDYSTPGIADAFRYKDKLYVGRYSRYNGLLIVDTGTMKIEKTINFFGGNNEANEVYTIQMYHPDTLWLGTNDGIVWFDTKTHRYGKVLDEKKYPGLTRQLVVLAPPRKDGYAWFCYHLSGVVGRYHIPSRSFTFFTSGTKPAFPFNKVKSLAYDAYGDVWFGGHALARWNNASQSFDTLIKVYEGINKFNDDILTITADDDGSLWMHNTDNGLLQYNIKEKKFTSYSMANGLPSGQIQCLSPVVDHTLWAAGDNYLASFNTLTKKTVTYDYQDGLPDVPADSRTISYDPVSGKFYLFCGDYLAAFPLPSIRNTTSGSGLLIQELAIANKRVIYYPADTVVLNYFENSLSVQFNIINFETQSGYRFEYKLNNADSWTMLEEQRSINLNELQPGKYIVHIKAIDKYGDEKTKNIAIIIKPPFWKTGWFLAGMGLLTIFTVVLIYRLRIKQIRLKANIDKQLAQAEMKALHSQMNPHFVFNSLNSIREMILNNENKEASHYLGKFAQLIRISLEHSGQSFVSLRNTLDYLHRYIEMEKIRNNHFTCTINVDKELHTDETVLPPMLIQPFIENAIWHGTTGSRKDISIVVDFKKQNNQLVCIIDDNGIGIEQSMKYKTQSEQLHHPFGISNIRDRIRLLNEKYNLESAVTIVDKGSLNGSVENGTLVTLYLPLETDET